MARLSRRAAFGAAAALPVAGAVAASSALPCPAAEIGRRLAVLAEEHNAADEAMVTAGPAERPAAERRFDALNAELGGLCGALATVQAISLPGAMAQLMKATCLALGGEMTDTGRAAFAGLMLSAVTVAERLGGVRREEMAGDYLMARHLDSTRGKPDGAGFPPLDAGLVAMADEVLRLWAAYKAKGEFLAPETDDADADAAAENTFYAEADAALHVSDRMAATRAFTITGVEAKARVCAYFDGQDRAYHEDMCKLGLSIAADVERGVLPARVFVS